MSMPFANATDPNAWTFDPDLVVKSYTLGNLNFPRSVSPPSRATESNESMVVGRTYEGKEGFILSSSKKGLLVHGTPCPEENLWRFSGWAIQPQVDPVFATLAWAVSHAEEEKPLITRDIPAPAHAEMNNVRNESDPYLRAGHTIANHLSSFTRILDLTFNTYPLASKETGVQFIDFHPLVPYQVSGIWHDEYHFKYIDWNGATSLTIERFPLVSQAILAAYFSPLRLPTDGYNMKTFAKQFINLANSLYIIAGATDPPPPELFRIDI